MHKLSFATVAVCIVGCYCKQEPATAARPAPDELPIGGSGGAGGAGISGGGGGAVTPVGGGEPVGGTVSACRVAESRSATLATRSSTSIETRIVGGSESTKHRPWMAAIVNDSGKLCGGTVIGDVWVLTAAHCDVRRTDRIIVGRKNLNDTTIGKVIAVADVLNHADYDASHRGNDVALVKLAEPADVQPIELYDGDDQLVGKTSLVLGWGAVSEHGALSPKLREVNVPIVSNQVCQPGYGGLTIDESMLCAGKPTGGVDSCQGDSGGPLTIEVGDRVKQVGIVSFGIGCAQPGHYGVYSRVSRLREWIDSCRG